MNKKPIIALLLCTMLCLSGCGGKSDTLSSAITDSNIESSSLPADSSSDAPPSSSSVSPSAPSAPESSAVTSLTTSVTPSSSSVLSSSSISEPIVKQAIQKGIDVSKWQGKIDWAKVKADGVQFAIIRIGNRAENGEIYKDDYADYNLQQAEKNGIITGVYFFSTAKNTAEAIAEAEWTARAVEGYPVNLVAWDCEGFLESDSRMYGMTAAARTDCAKAFCDSIKAAGYYPVCYASLDDLSSGAFEASRLENFCKIWVAHYPDVTYPQLSQPDYTGNFDLWQYTDGGTVNGVKNGCDMVVSYYKIKSATPKNAAARPNDTDAPSEENLIYETVKEDITAKDYVNLRASASTSAETVGTLKNGEVAVRTGIGSNGWSRLYFGGRTVYAVTSFLTTDLDYKPPVSSVDDGFTAVSDSMTAKSETNLRAHPSTNAEVVGVLKNGEFIKRTAKNERTGWSRLEYGGKTVYAVTSLLTDKLNESSSAIVEPSSKTETVYEQTFREVNEKVTAKDETNLRDKPTTEGSNIVYCLKNGEAVTRIGIGDMGWSKLDYGGQTVYAVTSYLVPVTE